MKSEKKNESPIPEMGMELERFEGDTFFLAEYEDGILYHVYNSMDLVIRRGVSRRSTCCGMLSIQLTMSTKRWTRRKGGAST